MILGSWLGRTPCSHSYFSTLVLAKKAAAVCQICTGHVATLSICGSRERSLRRYQLLRVEDGAYRCAAQLGARFRDARWGVNESRSRPFMISRWVQQMAGREASSRHQIPASFKAISNDWLHGLFTELRRSIEAAALCLLPAMCGNLSGGIYVICIYIYIYIYIYTYMYYIKG